MISTMKLICAFAALFHYAAAAEEYANARVVPNVLPPASLSQLTDDVGQIRLLRGNSEDGTNRQYGKTTVSTKDLELILSAIGAERPVHAPTSIRSALITGNTEPHKDAKVNADEFDEDETVVFVFLDSVPGAFFQIGEDKIPVEEGALVTFKGNSIVHNTIVPSGSELRLLGPIASRDLVGCVSDPTPDPTQNPTAAPTTGTPTSAPTTGTPTSAPTTGTPTTAPTTGTPTSAPTTGTPTSAPIRTPTPAPIRTPTAPTCATDVVCKPGVCFDIAKADECPRGHYTLYDYLLNVHHGCTDRVPVGSLCESDGECGTDNQLNNCQLLQFHAIKVDRDIYRRVACCPDPAPATASPSAAPTTSAPTTGTPTSAPATGTPTTAPTGTPTSAPQCTEARRRAEGGVDRRLGESSCPDRKRQLKEGEASPVKEDISLEEVHEIIRGEDANADASFSQKHDLISKESCDILINDLELSLAKDVASGQDLQVDLQMSSKAEFEDGGINNLYEKELSAGELVQLIGPDESLKIVEFFQESFGDLTINDVYLARHGPGEDGLFFYPWHKDPYANLKVTLNSDYDGGHFLELNAEGVHKIENVPGSAFSHGPDIVQGMTPNSNGAKYQLILTHHFDKHEGEEAVKLSKAIVHDLASIEVA